LDEIHSLVGVQLKPEKRKHADSTNKALGVDADLSAAASGRRVIFKLPDRFHFRHPPEGQEG